VHIDFVMDITARKPGPETRETASSTPAELRARPLPRSAEADPSGRSEKRRAGEPVTAYDHLWFQGRPLV
jgi:hypothetical protein